ncbi:MAG: hypothetical protein D6822_00135 [Cyanobacteria bacterium J149]|nr:MAG: hypothetical protein D6822_00135 [Cyanobacteria bacterium J149]
MTQPKNGRTKFEEDLEKYFPELYTFWGLFKFDEHYGKLMDAILEMTNQNATGQIRIVYQRGKINYITQEKHLTAFTKKSKLKPL